MDNTNIQSPWGRIQLMHRLLWSLHKQSLQIGLGIAAVLGALIGILALVSASEKEVYDFSSWGWIIMMWIFFSCVGISWFWGTYFLNHSVHRMVGIPFSTLPLGLREKCVAIGICILEGVVAFTLLGSLMAFLLGFFVEGLGVFGMLADIWNTGWIGISLLVGEIIEEAGTHFFLAVCVCLLLLWLADIALTLWSFASFGGYIKAFLIRMVASYVSWQLIWFFGMMLDRFTPWRVLKERGENPTNLWLMAIFLSAMIALALYRTTISLRTTDK